MVVLGYGVGGEMMAEVLREAREPFVVLDINAERVREARRRGEPIYFGDVTNPDILSLARVSVARQVVLMLNDPGATLRAVRTVRRLAPEVRIVARARYVADVPLLLEAGANEAVAQEFEASLEVIHRVMGTAPPSTRLRRTWCRRGTWSASRARRGRLPRHASCSRAAHRPADRRSHRRTFRGRSLSCSSALMIRTTSSGRGGVVDPHSRCDVHLMPSNSSSKTRVESGGIGPVPREP